jgi:hypothetical protein
MLFMTTYKFVGDRTPERTAALMNVFGERGEAEGTQAHYVRADSGGGWLIQEITDAATVYEDALAYSEWLEIESVPILGMDEAAPKILESLA